MAVVDLVPTGVPLMDTVDDADPVKDGVPFEVPGSEVVAEGDGVPEAGTCDVATLGDVDGEAPGDRAAEGEREGTAHTVGEKEGENGSAPGKPTTVVVPDCCRVVTELKGTEDPVT